MTGTLRAAMYRRISSDREGRELGVERQLQDLEGLARDRGYRVIGDYVDNDVSASTRTKKARPEYSRLVRDARAGAFDVVIAYTSSRLTRRPREHEDLIELAQEHGIRFDYVRSPSFDLGTAAGRRIARTLAASDIAEAEEISERVKRAAQQRAEKGQWHGGPFPPLGYAFQRVHEDGRARLGLQLDPIGAALLREAADRLLAGESLYAVTKDWTRRGVTTASGRSWAPATLRRALLSPSAIGCRSLGDADSFQVARSISDGDLAPAWEPVLDKEQVWYPVRSLLLDQSRRTFTGQSGATGGRLALTRLVACAICGETLLSHSYAGRPRYVCDKPAKKGCGKVTVDYAQLETWVVAAVWDHLGSDEWAESLAKPDTTEQAKNEQDALRIEKRSIEGKLDRLNELYIDGHLTKSEMQRRRDDLQRQLIDVESRTTRLAPPWVPDAWMDRSCCAECPSPQDCECDHLGTAAKLWDGADLEQRRRLLGSVIRKISVNVYPRTDEGQRWPTTLTRRWKQGETEEQFALRKAWYFYGVMEKRCKIEWQRPAVAA